MDHTYNFSKDKTQPKILATALAEAAVAPVATAIAPTATQVVDTCPKMTSLAH